MLLIHHQISTGVKCLPPSQIMPYDGCVVHDGHAEVLARRAFMCYVYAEMDRTLAGHPSTIFEVRVHCGKDAHGYDDDDNDYNNNGNDANDNGYPRFLLKPGIKFHFYVSMAPCRSWPMRCCSYR